MNLLENVHKRAFSIIYGERFVNRNYREFCQDVCYDYLADRCEALSRKFFYQNDSSGLTYSSPYSRKRNENILSKLRNLSQYCIPFARTEKFKKSFVIYALRTFLIDTDDDSDDNFIDF